MQEMTVYGVSFDLVGKQPIVLLRTSEGRTYLPIWIGHPEAAAILMRLQGQEPPRPLTHDLVCSIIDSLGAAVDRVTVTELRDSTFYARITLVRNGSEIEIDSRTSDAIAIALRADAKIFAEDDVIEESGVEFEGDEPDLDYAHRVSLGEVDMDEFRQFLDTVSPGRVRDRRRTSRPPEQLGRAELVLREREQLADEPVEALRPVSGPSFVGGERLRAGAPRGRDRAAAFGAPP